ncbi:radical SAM protein [candidate division KSB3 bacterium]|nr:radical SAM protein [candidate division KSB3 bacterium]
MAVLILNMSNVQIKHVLEKHPFLYSKIRVLSRWGQACMRISHDVNFFKCFVSAQLRLRRSLGRPVLLTLEPTNVCNLKCPVCETGCGELERTPVMMSLAEFKSVLDQFDDNLKMLYLYFMGESFLNKDIYKMIRYAAEKNLYVSICTNGEYVNGRELIDSGISEIQFQIGGATQETHALYRQNGDLAKTLFRVRETVAAKEEASGRRHGKARVELGFILMKHNEDQISDFLDLARNLEVDSWQIIKPCVRTIEQGKKYLPANQQDWVYDPESFGRGALKMRNPPRNYCEWIYSTVTVQANGDVVPCCRDPKGQYVLGNVFQDHIYDIWNNEKYLSLRNSIGVRQQIIDLCKLCCGYSIPVITQKG